MDFTNLSSQKIDSLKAAIVTKISGKSFHPIVITKLKSQCSKNNKIVELYYPGSEDKRQLIDLDKDCIPLKWNYVCVAFKSKIVVEEIVHDLVSRKGKIICNIMFF